MTDQEVIKKLEYVKTRCENEGRYTDCDVLEKAICALTENQQYHAIGTPEECRAAMEKQKEKKPIRNDLCTCPSCGTHNEVIKKRRNTVVYDIVYCWHCGQAIEIDRLE